MFLPTVLTPYIVIIPPSLSHAHSDYIPTSNAVAYLITNDPFLSVYLRLNILVTKSITR